MNRLTLSNRPHSIPDGTVVYTIADLHGHTMVSEPEIYFNRIGLNTGLYRHSILTCGIFEKNHIYRLQVPC